VRQESVNNLKFSRELAAFPHVFPTVQLLGASLYVCGGYIFSDFRPANEFGFNNQAL
jgi:hypothetical protein